MRTGAGRSLDFALSFKKGKCDRSSNSPLDSLPTGAALWAASTVLFTSRHYSVVLLINCSFRHAIISATGGQFQVSSADTLASRALTEGLYS